MVENEIIVLVHISFSLFTILENSFSINNTIHYIPTHDFQYDTINFRRFIFILEITINLKYVNMIVSTVPTTF